MTRVRKRPPLPSHHTVCVSSQVLSLVVILHFSNSTKASLLWQLCSWKKSHLIPQLPLRLSQSVCYFKWNFFQIFLFSYREWERERWRDGGMSEPHCNNTCKHRQCITQVMRSSTLLTLKAPLSNWARQTNTFLNTHTLPRLPHFPTSFFPPFLHLPFSPLWIWTGCLYANLSFWRPPCTTRTHTVAHRENPVAVQSCHAVVNNTPAGQ